MPSCTGADYIAVGSEPKHAPLFPLLCILIATFADIYTLPLCRQLQ
jgi:hypothetical protein